jgi:hypothetical protein
MTSQERQQMRARQRASKNDRPVGSGAVRLEYILGQIQADDAKLFSGRSPFSGASTPATLAHSMPPGASTPSLTHGFT